MDPTLPMMLVAMVYTCSLLYNFLALSRKGRKLAQLFRDVKNPDYPVTQQELLEEYRSLPYNPIVQTQFSFKMLFNMVRMIWSKYPKHKELDQKAREVRRIIYRQLLYAALAIVALILVILAAGPPSSS